MKRFLFVSIHIIIVILLAACASGDIEKMEKDKGSSSDKISIYTTVYPLQFFAERIGGNQVNVQSIYPPGADEHTFDPTQKDMMALADADLFLYIGLGLEGFVENAEKTMKNQHVKMIATADSIPHEQLGEGHDHHDHEDSKEYEHETIDPHVWISPILSIELAASIKDALIEISPTQKELFEKNFNVLKQDLEALDDDFQNMALKASSKTFFVSHAAFGYLAHSYGLEQVAIAGLNSQNEPSQKELTRIVDEAKAKKIHYILFEQNSSSKLTDVIRKELGVESLMLHNLGVLTPEDVKNNENYFTLMERNKNTLQKALDNR